MKMLRQTVMATMCTALLITAGCDIDKTEDGSMPDVDVSAEAGQMPEYEVIKTREGEMPDVDVDVSGGNMPEYDVDGPDVDVGSKTVEVEVPTVDVDLPDDDDNERY